MQEPDLSLDSVELRCRGTLHGIAKDATGTIEVKCKHWACNPQGSVTFHVFDLATGQPIETHTYKDPIKEKK